MTHGTGTTWWALARSEEVTDKKPLLVDLGDQPIVLWRNPDGTPYAVEDRCPHRRAPLSIGCVRSNGWIQCGYHGWSFDGATGRLAEVPNMKNDQRFPPHYKVTRYGVAECGGFVRVSLLTEAVPPVAASAPLPLAGTSFVALAHEQYLAALFDDPGLLLTIRGVRFTPYLMSELQIINGRLVMERSCQWSGQHWPAPYSSDFAITLLSRTDPVTGETDLVLRDADLAPLLTATLAPVPAARQTTAVRWRCQVMAKLPGLRAKLLALNNAFQVRETIDAAALRLLKPSVSIHAGDLRAAIAQATAA